MPQRTGTSHIAFGYKSARRSASIGASLRAGLFLELETTKWDGELAYFADPKFFSISSQFTTFHQASTYSGRRFWYFK